MRKIIIYLSLSIFFSNISYSQIKEWKGKIEFKDGVKYIHNSSKGLWDKGPSKKLSAEKIFSLGSLEAEEEYLFSWVKDITTDSEGKIYACDMREHRIQVYDKNGKYIRTIGRKGQGPGELMRPYAVRIGMDNRIYVQDDLNHRVSIFKFNGEFDNSFRYKGFVGEFLEIDTNGHILLYPFARSQVDEGKLPIVVAYDLKGNIQKEFGKRLKLFDKGPRGKPWYSINKFTMQKDGLVIVCFGYPYLVHFYRDGILERVVTKDDPNFTDPVIVNSDFKAIDGSIGKIENVVKRCSIWRVFPLPDGGFIVNVGDAGKDYKYAKDTSNLIDYIDLFSKEGYFLKRYTWDWKKHGMISHIDENGFLYSNCGDSEIVPGVSKWRVRFE